ncbi:zinc-dependent peptidase [Pareuzebyella sediminis]|uniref:zinc-dependent peptidase n=1 Tax=Pareuzebyella sediminis TaxID=2607998 RepID=UPI0011EBC25B|nr:zinc-dependent peptidase [Pareuzebyella sediminis]
MLTAEGFGTFLVLIYISIYLCYMIYYAFGLRHLNPLIRIKPLSPSEKKFLAFYFPIYPQLSVPLKAKCDERIIWFRSRKKFVFYGKTPKQHELKLLLSASMVLMTLGLNNFKMTRSLLRIVVYPSKYYSRVSRRHHLGEYNPRFKTAIFSANDIWEGFRVTDDNRNLAVHEFAHALSFEMVRKNTWEAKKFRVGLKKIKELFLREGYAQKVADSAYFRAYGMTNLQEFFSVAVENYVETPETFLKEYPELYQIIRTMLGFDFQPYPEKQSSD